MSYASSLDGLRAVAVLAVLAYHLGWLPIGHRGVDLFFIISGFLITRLLLAERTAHGRVSLRAFYARRALRLLPALAPVLVVCGVAMLAVHPTPKTVLLLASVVFYVANWTIAQGWMASPLDHTWSLAIEEQFYLLWPLTLLALLRGLRRSRLAGALMALVVAGGLTHALLTTTGPWSRLVGAVAGLAAHPLVIGCALGATGLSVARIESVLGWLGLRPLVWIGRRSYGLYLWHFPVLALLVGPVGVVRPTLTQSALVVAVTFAAAAASFRWLEQPMLARKAHVSRAPLTPYWWAPLGVAAATLAVFVQTYRFDFIRTWDDGGMLLFNANLLEWNWRFMTTSLAFGHWMPLTWLTWTIDAHAWGAWAGPWHVENALLHAASAAVVYLIARRLIGGAVGGATAALVFAVHPLRIESVAWISERKDVLSGLGVVLAVWLYVRAVDRGRYPWGALVAFALAVGAKSIAVVVVPFLLLLDWGVLRRRAWLEKVPFVVIACLTSAVAFYALHTAIHNRLPWSTVGLGPRALHVAYSMVFYLKQTLWPSRLSYMIEYTWMPSLDQPQYPLSVAIVLLVVVALVLARSRVLTAAALAYAVAVLPQSGLFQNGPQLVANRYSYLACLPWALLAGALVARMSTLVPRLALATASGGILALVIVTSVHLPVWANDRAVQTYAAEHEPTCTGCQDWAGVIAYERGDLRSTVRYLERAIPVSATTLRPRYERYWSLGKVLDELGDHQRAARWLRVYLAAIPADYRAWPLERQHILDAEARLTRLEALR